MGLISPTIMPEKISERVRQKLDKSSKVQYNYEIWRPSKGPAHLEPFREDLLNQMTMINNPENVD